MSVARSQLVKGVVRDADTKEPIAEAFAALVDSTGKTVYGTATDSRGSYVLRVREPGVYAVLATSPGYRRELSGWLQLTAKDTLEVTSTLGRPVNTLPSVVIKAQRDSLRALAELGLAPKSLSFGSIFTPAEVAAAALGSSTMYELVQSLHHATLRVKYMYDGSGNFTNCIVFSRTNSCVVLVIDGLLHSNFVDQSQLDNLVSPSLVAYMIFLHPSEAGVLYGTAGEHNGVLIIVTKSASRR